MTITVGAWVIPLLLMIFWWIWVLGKVNECGGGIGGGIAGGIMVIDCIAGTFFIWMVYFAIMYFIGG